MIYDVLEAPAPPRAHLGQHLALVRYRLAHDDIKGAHAIGRDQQEPIGIDAIDVAHLALA